MAENATTGGARPDTTVLRARDARDATPPERKPVPQTAPLPVPWRLLLQIGGENQTTVGLEIKDEIVLGRADPVADFHPELDLTPYGGQEAGVSRRHARIIQDAQKQALFIEDLKSTNGTRVNGFPLEAGPRYRLRDGDQIELGDLSIQLRFVRAPLR